jgi:Na+/citrate or Na+/malate symporter
MLGLGAQHVRAMFGSTALVAALTGFPVTTTIFSGVGRWSSTDGASGDVERLSTRRRRALREANATLEASRWR